MDPCHVHHEPVLAKLPLVKAQNVSIAAPNFSLSQAPQAGAGVKQMLATQDYAATL